jgi:methylenetetrahydrofolate--tRNA-(uracil-5-)-methyltransferase
MVLDATLRLKAMPRLRFAGQITGVEGYVESAAIGLLAGRFAAAERLGRAVVPPPPATALGALLNHITGGHIVSEEPARTASGSLPRSFQPMNINYGLLPPLDDVPQKTPDGKRLKGPERGLAKKKLQSRRALAVLADWLERGSLAAAAE